MKYDYKCTNCKNIFEKSFLINDVKPLVYCPDCKSLARRYITRPPQVKFEGQGFASNDIYYKPDPLEGYES